MTTGRFVANTKALAKLATSVSHAFTSTQPHRMGKQQIYVKLPQSSDKTAISYNSL
jgi:hypothetical protein